MAIIPPSLSLYIYILLENNDNYRIIPQYIRCPFSSIAIDMQKLWRDGEDSASFQVYFGSHPSCFDQHCNIVE
jgi:hypothetical protein